MLEIGMVFDILEKSMKGQDLPVVELVEARTHDPFKILVSTILSARTKDETTARVSEKLFKKVGTLEELEKISMKELEGLVYHVGFYKTKARHLKMLPQVLDRDFEGKIPQTLEGLLKLPGVGRKTANLVLSVAFNGNGICVDTHVHRIMNRMGYVKTRNPLETEMELRRKLPKKYWNKANFILVMHGQRTCKPISPHCSRCPITRQCKRIGVGRSR